MPGPPLFWGEAGGPLPDRAPASATRAAAMSQPSFAELVGGRADRCPESQALPELFEPSALDSPVPATAHCFAVSEWARAWPIPSFSEHGTTWRAKRQALQLVYDGDPSARFRVPRGAGLAHIPALRTEGGQDRQQLMMAVQQILALQ